ncbi:hypothetical protein GCM10027059_37880 [Myceligenerans halotolerans]
MTELEAEGPTTPSPTEPADAPEPDPVAVELARLTAQIERLNERAAHREAVIDHLHAEVERLRTGERRGVLRPALTAVARLRDDLLRQAETLPADFDSVQAGRLLRSFAQTVEILLDDNGIVVEAPGVGDTFDPRRHRARRTVVAPDVGSVGRVAEVRRPVYRDLETDGLLSPAEVLVYVAAPVDGDTTSDDNER